MKSLRLLTIALLACAATFSAAVACDAHKNSTTTASTASATKATGKGAVVAAGSGCCAEAGKHGTATATASGKSAAVCTAEMAAQCTSPAMRAACEKDAAFAAAMGCNMKGATSASIAGHTKGAKGATVASGTTCSMHGSSTAAANMDHCAAAKGANFTTASAGMKCSAHMSAVAHECSACEDWMSCEQDVRSAGGKAQVVPLKNGAMIVYTAESPAGVKALQTVVSKRNEKMMAALSAGSDKKLCDECKHLRGAVASGKLHREVVNVERGCMTLITSNDRAVVHQIRAMTGQPLALR